MYVSANGEKTQRTDKKNDMEGEDNMREKGETQRGNADGHGDSGLVRGVLPSTA